MTVTMSCRALRHSAKTAQSRVLVVGGGIGGMSCAIGLRQLGCAVDLVEQDPDWRVYGAGITVTGPSFRAFERLGVLPELLARGFGTRLPTGLHAASGEFLHDLPGFPNEGNLPSVGGVLRPVLHDILSARVKATGAAVRLGVTVADWRDQGDGVQVRFTDGSTDDYAMVVAVDGAFSQARTRLFPDAPMPSYTGQYCWRLLGERPPGVNRPQFFVAGRIIAGLVPVSATQMYMFLLQPLPEKIRIDAATQHELLAQLMAPFGGVLGELRDGLQRNSSIIVRPLEAVLLPQPWYKGNILLMGDAAHATTPHLASGAGMAVEDGLVLCELLQQCDSLQDCFAAFMRRRWERCRLVVENSVAIGYVQQQEHPSMAQMEQLMGAAKEALRAPI